MSSEKKTAEFNKLLFLWVIDYSLDCIKKPLKYDFILEWF